jgi:hypothetical protein
MSLPYLDGDQIRELREALRLGAELNFLAGKVGCTADELAKLLDLPKPKPVRGDVETGVDLWSVDRAKEVL